MARRKLMQFAENKLFPHLVEPEIGDILENKFQLKGNWKSQFFKNENNLVIELGCGKGEYCVGLGKIFPDKNFLGLDIKGNRLWRGAKDVEEQSLNNVGFLRSKVDYVEALFGENEVDELWLTFSDPQPKKPERRLSSQKFLDRYKNFLKPGAIIHLKTDNRLLFNSTLEVIRDNGHKLIYHNFDIYNTWNEIPEEIKPNLSLKTYFEEKFMQKNYRINYLQFSLKNG